MIVQLNNKLKTDMVEELDNEMIKLKRVIVMGVVAYYEHSDGRFRVARVNRRNGTWRVTDTTGTPLPGRGLSDKTIVFSLRHARSLIGRALGEQS